MSDVVQPRGERNYGLIDIRDKVVLPVGMTSPMESP